MALLLNIDTATNYGAVAVSYNGEIVSVAENYNQKDHAVFLHAAIEKVLADTGEQVANIDAVTVVIGPGSYTGLRVGLSAAKGLCYATGKPLIGVNTLQAIALAATTDYLQTDEPALYVPMIDARRMEVFTAVYDKYNQLYISPEAVVIDEEFLKGLREDFFLVFAGSGSKKLEQVLSTGNYKFSTAVHTIKQVVQIGEDQFNKGAFEDVAYSEPFYLKPFFSTTFVKK